jgi:hypothetical protein
LSLKERMRKIREVPAKSDGDISSHSNHFFDCKTPMLATLSK